jgi:hypothetical protein
MRRIALSALSALIASSALSWAQSPSGPAAPEKPGIYIDGAAGEVRRLPVENSADVEVKGMGTAMLTQGIVKPKQVVKHAGAKSAFVIKGTLPAFLFRFPPKKMPTTPSEMMELSGEDALPFGTKHPKDFILGQPTVEGDTRIFDTGKIQKIKFEIEQLKPDTFRVRVLAPLAPGEYAFYMSQAGGVPMMIWSFSYQN